MTDKGQFYNDDNKKGNDYNGFGRFFFFTVEEMKPEILMHWNLAFTLSFREWIQSREATPSRGSWNLFKVASVDMCVCMCVLSHSVMSLCNCSPPGSFVHGILQARILEPFPSPGDFPNPGIEPASCAFLGGFFTTEPSGKLVFTNWFPVNQRL